MSGPADDLLFAALEEIWTSAEGSAEAMSAAEADVVRWAWFSDSSCCSPEPFGAQRAGDAPGRELRGEPDLTSASAARCGFDEHNRAVVSCWHYNAGHSVTYTVRFLEEDNRCRELVFERDELLSATLYEYHRDVLVRQASRGRPAPGSSPRQLSEYFYRDDGRLDRVRRRSWDDGERPETRRRAAVGMTEAFEYDEEGRLSRITACGNLPDAQPHVVYKRRTTTSSAPQQPDRTGKSARDIRGGCGRRPGRDGQDPERDRQAAQPASPGRPPQRDEGLLRVAVDLELVDLDGNLRAALGEGRYRTLRDAGLTAE